MVRSHRWLVSNLLLLEAVLMLKYIERANDRNRPNLANPR